MEIAYDVDRVDLIDYNMHIFMQPARRRERLLKSLSFSAVMAVPGLILLDSQLPGLGCIMFVVAATIPLSTAFVVPRNVRRQLSRLYPRNETSALYGWRRMTIDAERILQVGELMVTGWKWLAVERIEVTDRLVLFFVSQSAALMIPRRAFADEAALRQFVETAERFHRAAPAFDLNAAPPSHRGIFRLGTARSAVGPPPSIPLSEVFAFIGSK